MTECSKCGYLYEKLNRQFEGWGRRVVVPKGRWHSARDIKKVTFAVEVPVCERCGGEPVEETAQVPLWKQAREAWKSVDGELLKMRGKR